MEVHEPTKNSSGVKHVMKHLTQLKIRIMSNAPPKKTSPHKISQNFAMIISWIQLVSMEKHRKNTFGTARILQVLRQHNLSRAARLLGISTGSQSAPKGL